MRQASQTSGHATGVSDEWSGIIVWELIKGNMVRGLKGVVCSESKEIGVRVEMWGGDGGGALSSEWA